LISAAEGNSLQSWNTVFDSAEVVNGAMQYGDYNGSQAVLQGDGDLTDPTDNYQNAIWNHLYFYENLEGDNSSGTSLEADKIRLGVSGQPGPFANVAYPTDCGPAFHPLGPVTTDENGNTVYKKTEVPPEFVGGSDALRKYLDEQIQLPGDAEEGKVFVAFIVADDGSVVDARVVRGVRKSMGEEALRLIKGMPKWDPAMRDGKPVYAVHGIPVSFKP
jgi:hypothetical protein